MLTGTGTTTIFCGSLLIGEARAAVDICSTGVGIVVVVIVIELTTVSLVATAVVSLADVVIALVVDIVDVTVVVVGVEVIVNIETDAGAALTSVDCVAADCAADDT